MNTSVIDLSKANRRQELVPAQAEPSEMQALIAVMQQAISNPDIPIERMEKLVGIALDATERMDANRARKAYAAAMAEFKRNPPKIVKDAHVKYTTNKGTTEYDHATLGALCEAVIAGLAEVGISHEWQQSLADGKIQVTCILTHSLGHKEKFPGIPALPDDSGGKNAIQANQSTVTYLERSTLFGATGLSALAPRDNDGRGAPSRPPLEPMPEGYADWRADMTAKADDGADRLTEAWSASTPAFRRYVIKFDEPWWNDCKAKAAKVSA